MSGETWQEWECPECGLEPGSESAFLSHKYGGHKLDDGATYIERYQQARGEIPEKYLSMFDDLTGSGRGIKSVQAAIEYIESPITQEEAAMAFDTTAITVRDITRELIDSGVVSLEYVQENSLREGKGQFNGDGDQCGGTKVKHGI